LNFSKIGFGDFSAEKDDLKFPENLLSLDRNCGHTLYFRVDPNGFPGLLWIMLKYKFKTNTIRGFLVSLIQKHEYSPTPASIISTIHS
jgi:hypothetical protein